MFDVEKHQQKVLDHISGKKSEIKRKLDMPTKQKNTLLAQVIAAYVEKFPALRFSQVIVNLGILREVTNSEGTVLAYENEFNTSSDEFVHRLGGKTAVLKTVSEFVRGKGRATWKDDQSRRLIYNRMILGLLLTACQKYENWEFGKLLRHLEIVKDRSIDQGDFSGVYWANEYNTESSEIYQRVSKHEKVIKE